MSRELPILPKGTPIPATHYEQVTRGHNAVRRVTGDKRYIAADLRAGSLTIQWVGPTVAAAGSIIRRFKVKSTTTDWLVCRLWDGTTEGANDIKVARAFPDRINYPVNRVIYATQPTGGTGITDGDGAPVTWLDARLTVGQFFPVLVTQDGGSNGSQTTKATYTYTVKSLDSVVIGEDIAVVKPRENGGVVTQDADGYGVAFYNASGTLLLWDAGETYTTVECTT